MPAPAAAPANSTTVAFAKSMFNVMDTGSITFTFTLGVMASWNSTGRAYLEVPKYYRPDLGDGVRCQLTTNGTLVEELYCEMRWDWSLMVWGPRAASIDNTTSHELVVSGVVFTALPAGGSLTNW